MHAQSATIDELIITPPAPSQNSIIALYVSGELGNNCHRVLEQNLTIDNESDTVSLAVVVIVDSETVCTPATPAATVPFTVTQPIGILDAGEYTVEVDMNNGLATASTTISVGGDSPDLSVSPPTGRYITGQTFDMAIIISGTEATVESGFIRFGPQISAASDWLDITSDLLPCLLKGSLTNTDSTVLLCRDVSTDLAGPGRFGVLVNVVLSDGTVLNNLATWEIRAAEGF